jgi:Ca2+-binding EF-hand superfamily protein
VNNALQTIFTVRNAEKIHLQDFVQVLNDNYSSEFSRDEVVGILEGLADANECMLAYDEILRVRSESPHI